MQIPINKLTKMLRTFPQWSTAMTITLCLYLLFIMVVLSISFPLKSHRMHLMSIERNHVNENTEIMDTVNNNDELGDIEAKLLQRAKDLPIVSNCSEILRDAFNKADLNGDSMLTMQELGRFINQQIRAHISASIHNNPFHFSDIDRAPRNGLVTWDEYYAHFLQSHGFSENAANVAKWGGKVNLDRNTNELLARDRALWNEAARTDSFSLTLDEFLAFQHPESSAANMLSLVDDLLRQFDEDGDEHLTMDEFSNVVADDLDDKWRRYMIEKTTFQRQEEFKRLIDKNHDGIANRSELLSYVSPKHPRHALQEAAALFNLADRNRDHWLTLPEIEKAGNIFMASRMINSAQTFHDIF